MKNLLALVILIICLWFLYNLKSDLGINLTPGEHLPKLLERETKGLIKCTWFGKPAHCK